MEQFHEPIPTEYDGVLFKSKSEAIFARNMSLVGMTWEYEPERFTSSDGWIPDFFAVFKGSNKKIWTAMIEYKPSQPSNAYFKNASRRFYSIGFGKEYPPFQFALIASGSSFTDQKFLFDLKEGNTWKMSTQPWIFNGWGEASKYRFDLHRGGRK